MAFWKASVWGAAMVIGSRGLVYLCVCDCLILEMT